MTTYDVIVDYDEDKAKALYKFLKTARCSDLAGSNLLQTYMNNRSPEKAYRIQVDSKNKYRYMYSLSKYEAVVTPVEFYKFMERTLKL